MISLAATNLVAVRRYREGLRQRTIFPPASSTFTSPRFNSRTGFSIFLRSPTMTQVNASGWMISLGRRLHVAVLTALRCAVSTSAHNRPGGRRRRCSVIAPSTDPVVSYCPACAHVAELDLRDFVVVSGFADDPCASLSTSAADSAGLVGLHRRIQHERSLADRIRRGN